MQKRSLRSFSGGLLRALRLLFTRNALLVILINILYSYGNYMKNGFRSLIAYNEANASTTVIGLAASLFLIVGLLCRSPSGAVCDLFRKSLKYILCAALVLKALCWCAFLLVSDTATLSAVYALDGVMYAFLGTALPTILAVSVDRRVMGSGYAIMIGLTDIISASARPNGILLYDRFGIEAALAAAGGLMLLAAALSLGLNGRALLPAEPLQSAAGPKPPASKARLLRGISLKMLPLCLVANMPIVLFAAESNFFPLFAESAGVEYLGATALGGGLYGVLSCAVGFLCDIVEPRAFIIIGLLGQIAAPFLWAAGRSDSVIRLGILLFYASRFYGTAIRIAGMKHIEKERQGAFQATFMAGFDLFSIVSALMIGILISAVGYQRMWLCTGVWCVLALLAYIRWDAKSRKNP